MSDKPSFFAELQRRHVYKVGAAYAVAGWLLVQVVTQVFPIFEVSALAQRIIVLVIVAGFPFALILSWLFDITSQGIVRTGELPASGEAPAVRAARHRPQAQLCPGRTTARHCLLCGRARLANQRSAESIPRGDGDPGEINCGAAVRKS